MLQGSVERGYTGQSPIDSPLLTKSPSKVASDTKLSRLSQSPTERGQTGENSRCYRARLVSSVSKSPRIQTLWTLAHVSSISGQRSQYLTLVCVSDLRYICRAKVQNQGFTLNVDPNNSWLNFKWFTVLF